LKKLGLYITKDSKQTGDLNIEGDVRIDGSFMGRLITDGNLYIGFQGYFEGEAHTEEAYIEGQFSGALEAKIKTTLSEAANFSGILDTPLAEIPIGAQIIGTVRICNRNMP
jgi:cytoskeletal protein CcmA (bactofilin family)